VHNQDSSLLSVFADANALLVRVPNAPEAPAMRLSRRFTSEAFSVCACVASSFDQHQSRWLARAQ
jgi:hypothetical protein